MKKRKIPFLIIVFSILCILLSGCNKGKNEKIVTSMELSSETSEVTSMEPSLEISETIDVSDKDNSLSENETDMWKQLYLAYVLEQFQQYQNNQSYLANYGEDPKDSFWGSFVYIDGDDIPEMILCKENESAQMVVSCHNGELQVYGEDYSIANYSQISNYIESDGKFSYEIGGIGHSTITCELSDDGFHEIHQMDSCPDPEGNLTFYYDGTEVSEEDLSKISDQDYDGSKSKEISWKDLFYDEIIDYLTSNS